MPIDLAQVDWLYVAVLAMFVFLATFVGNLLSFNHRLTAAVLSALLFVAIFVFWTYYPHRVPLPSTISMPNSAASDGTGASRAGCARRRRKSRAIRSPISRRRAIRLRMSPPARRRHSAPPAAPAR